MAAAERPAENRCPNCHAIVMTGSSRCSVCKMEVSKMAEFAAAKKAALQKGLRTQVDEAKRPRLISSQMVSRAVVLLVVLGIIGGAVIYFKARLQPWEGYPTSRVEAVEKLMGYIAIDNDKSLKAAYGMLGSEIRTGASDSDHGHYLQLFHEVNKYLAGEFGNDWPTKMTVTPSKENTDVMLVKVGLETLHVGTLVETPKEKLDGKNKHYSIGGFQEFDVNEGARLQQMAIVGSVLKGYGAEGSANQLSQIAAASGNLDRETAMQTKRRILPILGNPHGEAVKRMVYHAWVVRTDPVVRARLQAIVDDGRYATDVRELAKQVLENRVNEEELIAAGVNRTN